MTATKETKLQRLEKQLAAAREALAKTTARLQPQLDAADAEVARLRAERNHTESAAKQAREALQQARSACGQLLGLIDKRGYALPQLLAELKAFAQARGFDKANEKNLASRYIQRLIDEDPEVQALTVARDKAQKHAEAAYGRLNHAESPFGEREKLRRQLRALQEHVEKLETEIEKLPRRREDQRERRAQAREEELCDRHTAAALALLAEFKHSGGAS